MQYRKGPGDEPVSVLGYGCMRFSRKNGLIDLNKTEKELGTAIEGGVNYLDTAYIYPGSETALGRILSRNHWRNKVNLATKLPQYLIKSSSAPDRFFSEQQKRLQTDHIDYYLLHMLSDVTAWRRLESLGIEDWLEKKKREGQIRYIGFSHHGSADSFLSLLDLYPWDFCQIQYNYMDEYSQAGRTGLTEAARRGISVFIMEPLRGGNLTVKLPPQAKEQIQKKGQGITPAQLALRWLWNQPEITCVLSGMNSLETVKENLLTASHAAAGCLTESESLLIREIKEIINTATLVNCTGCAYCMPCPQGVDIPGAFRCLNVSASDGLSTARKEYLRNTLISGRPSGAGRCINCKKCIAHCPQHIDIPSQLSDCAKKLETPLYRLAGRFFQFFR